MSLTAILCKVNYAETVKEIMPVGRAGDRLIDAVQALALAYTITPAAKIEKLEVDRRFYYDHN